MAEERGITRREFVQLVTIGGAGAFVASCAPGTPKAGGGASTSAVSAARLLVRPTLPTETIGAGVRPLGLSAKRDALIYVPPALDNGKAAPLLVLLHGAGASAAGWKPEMIAALADPSGIIVVAPSSSGETWDLRLDGYGPDVEVIDASMRFAFDHCRVDPARLGLAGFSDGASYALSLGLENGDLFGALLAFSPGVCATDARRGTPRVYITHGTRDIVLRIDSSSRLIVPKLRQLGYAVTYREFDGGHTMDRVLAVQGMRWFAGP